MLILCIFSSRYNCNIYKLFFLCISTETLTCHGWMSVVDAEQKWPRNGRLIGHVANETVKRKQLRSYRPVRWSKIYPCGLISHTHIDCTLDLLKQIEGSTRYEGAYRVDLPKSTCLVSMIKCVLLCNVWETSSPNHTAMIMVPNVTLQCSQLKLTLTH